jgi:hypothetical protein
MIEDCLGHRILSSMGIRLRYSLMDVFGTDARSAIEGLVRTRPIGILRRKETDGGIGRQILNFGNWDGRLCEFGNTTWTIPKGQLIEYGED